MTLSAVPQSIVSGAVDSPGACPLLKLVQLVNTVLKPLNPFAPEKSKLLTL